jgi:predicted nucleotidyltransferase
MAVLDAEVKRRALAATRILARLGTVRAAYVFGSHVEGRAGRWSDIDVAAFMKGIETWDIRRRARAMTRVQEEAGLDVEAHLFPDSALDNPPAASFAEYILKHGVCIQQESSES